MSYVTLYGTGFRNARNVSVTVDRQSAQLFFTGPQGQYPGLDQANIAGYFGQNAQVVLTADGVMSDAVVATSPRFHNEAH